MTPANQFATMRLVRSSVQVDDDGELIRIETRKCDRTGLVLTRRSMVAPSEAYLAASPSCSATR